MIPHINHTHQSKSTLTYFKFRANPIFSKVSVSEGGNQCIIYKDAAINNSEKPFTKDNVHKNWKYALRKRILTELELSSKTRDYDSGKAMP